MKEKDFKIFKDIQKNGRWYVDLSDEVREQMEQRLFDDGFVRIENPHESGNGAKSVRYGSEADYILIHNKQVKKVEAIMNHFGATEWMEVLKNEAGISPEANTIEGLFRLTEDQIALKKYREVRDRFADMAKQALEDKSGVVRHGY
jgi:hypothetical protein